MDEICYIIPNKKKKKKIITTFKTYLPLNWPTKMSAQCLAYALVCKAPGFITEVNLTALVL
jgi:hypothetical protein